MESVHTDAAPKAVGPYSQAVKFPSSEASLVYTAGQVALDPGTGKLVTGGVGPETVQVLANLSAVLREAGSGLDRVVKTTVFLTDLADFQVMNAIYAEAFGSHRPARSTVQVGALPLGARVEIEAVALT